MNISTLAFRSTITLALAALSIPAQDHAAKTADHVQHPTKNIVETAVGAGSFETLVTAVKAAGLVETLSGKGPFTVFAPTDEAFAKLGKQKISELLEPKNKQMLADILTYHVVSGAVKSDAAAKLSFAPTVEGSAIRVEAGAKKGTLTVDGANVVKTDILCSNGVIHVIDAVILPRPNIVATAKNAGSFNTLLKAATAAGLVEALSGKEPLTVFAPTDEAFAKLPKETLAALLTPEGKDKLAAILKYHVVPGRMLASDVLGKKELTTLQGKAAKISVEEGTAKIDGAKILKTDVLAGNGVIHVIDAVILP